MKKTEPLISVIIPIYNVERYIDKCVESVIDQTYNNLEIILVDDGSPDNCGKICDGYALQDKRIHVIHKKNGGLSDARNVAIDSSNGEYITFIDGDDFVGYDYISTLYELVTKYDVKLSISSFVCVSESKLNKNYRKNNTVVDEVLLSDRAIENMFYQNKFETSAWGKLYKKELFDSGIRYPEGLLYEDLPTTYLLILNAKRIAYTDKNTYYYLIRHGSIQQSNFNEKKMDILKVSTMIIPNIKDNYPQLYPALKCRLFSAYMNVFLQINVHNEFEKILWGEICKYRFSVLSNIHARKKSIIAAFISIFGMKILRCCYYFVNKNRNAGI